MEGDALIIVVITNTLPAEKGKFLVITCKSLIVKTNSIKKV